MQPFLLKKLEAGGTSLNLQVFPGGRSALKLIPTLTYTHSHSLTHSSQPEPKAGKRAPVPLPPQGGLGQVPAVSSADSISPHPALATLYRASLP